MGNRWKAVQMLNEKKPTLKSKKKPVLAQLLWREFPSG
jgi:hypothetical protein